MVFKAKHMVQGRPHGSRSKTPPSRPILLIAFLPIPSVVCPQTLHIKSRGHISTYRAADIFELLSSRNLEMTLEDRVEIRKQNALDEAEKPEAEPKKKTTAVLQLTGRAWTD